MITKYTTNHLKSSLTNYYEEEPPPCPPPHFIQTKFRSALPSRTINETQEVPLSLVLFSLSFMFDSYKYFPDKTHWMEYFIKIEIATDFCKQNRPGVLMLNVL